MIIIFKAYSTGGSQWYYSDRFSRTNPVLNNPTLKNISIKHNISTTELAMLWALQEGAVVIPKTKNKHHLKRNARLLLMGRNSEILDPDDMKKIRTLDNK